MFSHDPRNILASSMASSLAPSLASSIASTPSDVTSLLGITAPHLQVQQAT